MIDQVGFVMCNSRLHRRLRTAAVASDGNGKAREDREEYEALVSACQCLEAELA